MSSPSPHHHPPSLSWGLGVPRGSPGVQEFSSMLGPALSIFGPGVTRTVLIPSPTFQHLRAGTVFSRWTHPHCCHKVWSHSPVPERGSLLCTFLQSGAPVSLAPELESPQVWEDECGASRVVLPTVLAGELTSAHAPQSRSFPDGCVTALSRTWSLSH